MKEEFVNFIKSDEGNEVLLITSEGIMSVLKQQDFTIREILSEELDEKVEEFFHSKLPIIINKLTWWLRSTKAEFDLALEESVNEAIASYSGAKKTILSAVRSTFLDDIANKYGIIEKITMYLENNKEEKKLSNILADKALSYLSNTSISDIITDLEEKNILNSKKVFETLEFNIDKIISGIPDNLLMNVFEIKIGSLVSDNIEIESVIDNKIKSKLKDFIFNYINKGDFTNNISDLISHEFEKINKLKLNEIFNEPSEKQLDLVKKFFYESLDKNELIITEKISGEMQLYLNKKTLEDVLPDQSLQIIMSKVNTKIYEEVEEKLSNILSVDLEEIVNKINRIDNIEGKTKDSFLKILDEKLEVILKGNIKNTVSENIGKLSNEELNEMMKDFMGKELKAINVAGAFLGGAVGLATNFIPETLPYSGLINIPLYALIGVITNSIAIKMIFKPYEPVPLIKLQGVVPKNKSKFAENMSHFVDQRLLNKEVAQNVFEDNKEAVLNMIKNEISSDNYGLITELVKQNEVEIFDICFEMIKLKILENKNKISEGIFRKYTKI